MKHLTLTRVTVAGLFAFLLSACGNLTGGSYSLNKSGVTVARGSSVSVGVVAPGLQAAPVITAEATNPSSGLTVEVAPSGPNPAEVRAIVTVNAGLAAPLGKQNVLVKFPSGSATFEVTITGGSQTVVRGLGRTTTAASGGRVTVWIKNDGSVWQRSSATSSAVPGVSDAKSVGLIDCCGNLEYTAVAATADGTVWTWDSKLAPQRVAQIQGGVVDIAVAQFPTFALVGFALGTDGRVWRLNLQAEKLAATLEPDIADVAAIRVYSRSRFIGSILSNELSVTYLKMDGSAQIVGTNEYLGGTPSQPAPPNERKVTSGGPDLIDINNTFGQLADGRVYYGKYRVHNTPVKHFESSLRIAQPNGSNSTSVLTAFCLFADGSLWQTALINEQSLGQAGNPLSASSTIQQPLTLPNNADVLDFALVGNGVLAWTANGLYFAPMLSNSASTTYEFQPLDLPDLRRPSQ